MTSYAEVQLNNTPCINGSLDLVSSYAWTSELSTVGADDTFNVGDAVTLTIAGQSWAGTVVQGADPDLRYLLRIVGGAGKLDTLLDPCDYQGQDLAYCVQDVLQTAGEKVGDLSQLNTINLAHWLRGNETASRSLHRLMRLAPPGVYLQVQQDGTWSAIKASWNQVGQSTDEFRDTSYPSEDACSFSASIDLMPVPLTSMLTLGQVRRIDRVQYSWSNSNLTALVFFRYGDDQFDRLRAAIKKVVVELLEEERSVNFGRLYGGKVAVTGGDNGQLDVMFEDDLNRLQSVTGAKLFTEVGTATKLQAGTRVLVGWVFGDERFPFVLHGSWGGNGGLVDLTRTFTGSYTLKGNNVNLGDMQPQCDPVMTATDGTTLYAAISGAVCGTADGGATFKLNLLAALSSAGWGGTPPPGPVGTLGSKIVRAKR